MTWRWTVTTLEPLLNELLARPMLCWARRWHQLPFHDLRPGGVLVAPSAGAPCASGLPTAAWTLRSSAQNDALSISDFPSHLPCPARSRHSVHRHVVDGPSPCGPPAPPCTGKASAAPPGTVRFPPSSPRLPPGTWHPSDTVPDTGIVVTRPFRLTFFRGIQSPLGRSWQPPEE